MSKLLNPTWNKKPQNGCKKVCLLNHKKNHPTESLSKLIPRKKSDTTNTERKTRNTTKTERKTRKIRNTTVKKIRKITKRSTTAALSSHSVSLLSSPVTCTPSRNFLLPLLLSKPSVPT